MECFKGDDSEAILIKSTIYISWSPEGINPNINQKIVNCYLKEKYTDFVRSTEDLFKYYYKLLTTYFMYKYDL